MLHQTLFTARLVLARHRRDAGQLWQVPAQHYEIFVSRVLKKYCKPTSRYMAFSFEGDFQWRRRFVMWFHTLLSIHCLQTWVMYKMEVMGILRITASRVFFKGRSIVFLLTIVHMSPAVSCTTRRWRVFWETRHPGCFIMWNPSFVKCWPCRLQLGQCWADAGPCWLLWHRTVSWINNHCLCVRSRHTQTETMDIPGNNTAMEFHPGKLHYSANSMWYLQQYNIGYQPLISVIIYTISSIKYRFLKQFVKAFKTVIWFQRYIHINYRSHQGESLSYIQ